MEGLTYDDSELMKLFESLSEKRRRQALAGGFRRAAANVRRPAVSEMRSSGIRSNPEMEKGIRAVVYRKVLGFKITVAPRRRKIDYTGLSGKDLSAARRKARMRIVPLWAEGGTAERHTDRSTRRMGFSIVSHGKGRRTGAMPAFGFMERARASALPGAADDLRRQLDAYIKKTAARYGARY